MFTEEFNAFGEALQIFDHAFGQLELVALRVETAVKRGQFGEQSFAFRTGGIELFAALLLVFFQNLQGGQPLFLLGAHGLAAGAELFDFGGALFTVGGTAFEFVAQILDLIQVDGPSFFQFEYLPFEVLLFF